MKRHERVALVQQANEAITAEIDALIASQEAGVRNQLTQAGHDERAIEDFLKEFRIEISAWAVQRHAELVRQKLANVDHPNAGKTMTF